MAHMSRSGIYWRLRDGNTSWADKVKLARYAWSQASVHIPNKHQVLLDWLVLELTGKKRVKAEESGPLWRCFRDMVHSPCCQKSDAVVIRNLVGQILIEELNAHSTVKQRHCADTQVLTSCIHGLLTSPGLRTIFTHKLEVTILLTKAVLDLFLSEEAGEDIPSATADLLDLVLAELALTQWNKINVQQVLQVVCGDLLLSVCKFSAFAQQSGKVQLLQQVRQLQRFVGKALFPQELYDHYMLYLNMKAKPGKISGTLPKDVETVFSSLDKHLNSKADRKLILEFLPELYTAFFTAYDTGDSWLWFNLLTVLVRMMGVDVEGEGQRKFTSLEAKAVSRLLEIAGETELEVPGLDPAGGKDQVTWFQKLGQMLLNMDLRSSAWFDCFRHLVLIDHRVVEMHLVLLLANTWINVKVLDAEASLSQGKLLQELVMLYGRLRRFPTLIHRFLSSLRESSADTALSYPKAFHNSLVSVIGSLQPNTCVTLWQSVLTEVETHYNQDDNIVVKPGLEGVLYILSVILLHAHLADYTVPHQVVARVGDLMKTTQNSVNKHVLHHSLKETSFLRHALYITWAWGELHLTLKQFTSYTHGGATASGATSHHDLTLLHDIMDVKQWSSLFKRARNGQDEKSIYVLNLLVLQKMRAILLSQTEGAELNLTSVKNTVTYIMSQLPAASDVDLSGHWDGELGSVCEGSRQVALLDLVCEQLPLILPFCSGEQLLSIADILLSISTRSEVSLSEEGTVTLGTITRKLFRSSACQELETLHSALVTAAALRLHKILKGKPSKSPKKVKASSSSPGDLLLKLGSTDTEWNQSNLDAVQSELEGVGEEMMKLLTKEDKRWAPSSQKGLKEIISILQIFDDLPLEHFQVVNRARCLLIMLALGSSSRLELAEASLSRLLVVLDSPEVSSILPLISPCDVLVWLLEDSAKETLELRSKVSLQILKHATKDLKQAKSLTTYFSMCQQLIQMSPSSSVNSEEQMIILGNIMGSMKAIAERAHQKPELQDLCKHHFQEMCSNLLLLFDRLNTKRHRKACVGPTWECVLTCYRHMLDHVCYSAHLQQKLAEKKQNQEKPEAKASEKQKMEIEEQKEEVESDESSEESESEESESEESGESEESSDKGKESGDEPTADRLLSDVESRLPGVCDIIFNILQEEKNGSSVKCCLPLIVSISSNYSLLKSQLKENFIQNILGHLLSNLYNIKPKSNLAKQSPTSGSVREGLDNDNDGDKMEVDDDGEVVEELGYDEDVLRVMQNTVPTVMSVLKEEDFSDYVQKLLKHLNVNHLQHSPMEIVVTMGTMQALLNAKMDEENYRILGYASQNMLLPLQEIVQHFESSEPSTPERRLLTQVLSIQAQMLTHGKMLLSPRAVTICLHSFHYLPLEALHDLDSFSAFHQAAYSVLNEMLVSHERIVFHFIPAFISAAKRLMTSVILQGDQRRRPLLSEADTNILVSASLRVCRLFSLIATHKVDFAKVAPYMVAEYVEHLQKVTLLPKVKKSLVGGIHKILDLCDTHAINLLRTVLPSGGKEIFRFLHLEYNKYYRYTGRI